MLNTNDMVATLLAQLDMVAARNYPDYVSKWPARAGALQAVLASTLGHLNEEQRALWIEHNAAVFAIQMEQEVQA